MAAAIGRGGKGSPYGAASRSNLPGAKTGEQHGQGNSGGFGAWFTRVAGATANAVGSHWAFLVAATVVVVWAVTGPIFSFSDTWQLVINTGTTIVTFLMVFLIQNTQNRDAKALHLKLDELLRAVSQARNDLIDIEQDTDANLEEIQKTYRHLREKAPVTGTPPLPEEQGRPGPAA
jgi:low affinity Fe/Cu permease